MFQTVLARVKLMPLLSPDKRSIKIHVLYKTWILQSKYALVSSPCWWWSEFTFFHFVYFLREYIMRSPCIAHYTILRRVIITIYVCRNHAITVITRTTVFVLKFQTILYLFYYHSLSTPDKYLLWEKIM